MHKCQGIFLDKSERWENVLIFIMGATGGQYHLKDYVFIALNCFTWDSIDVLLLS